MRPFSHLDIAHTFWQKIVCHGDTVIDATAGNGHDSLFLASLALGDSGGKLIALDIQKSAIDNTKCRLKDFPEKQISLYEMCHSRLKEVAAPESVKLIAFNLGYLPGGDKSLTTRTLSTLAAIKAALDLIIPGGLVSITCYPGHAEGLVEENAILPFCQALDPKVWSVSSHTFINRTRHPHLILLQRHRHDPATGL